MKFSDATARRSELLADLSPSTLFNPFTIITGPKANQSRGLSLSEPIQAKTERVTELKSPLFEPDVMRAPMEPRIPSPEVQREVKAVIAKVSRDNVVVACQLPSDRVEVQISRALVPDDLAVFATPVWIGLADVGGFSTPVVRRRDIDPTAVPALDREIEEWLSSV